MTSSPLAEQTFHVDTIDQLQVTPQQREMANIITCGDSDAWSDLIMPPIVSRSTDPSNGALLGPAGRAELQQSVPVAKCNSLPAKRAFSRLF
jgi:phospholipase C